MSRNPIKGNRLWSWDTALLGVVPPMISPLAPSGDVDEAAVAVLVEHILAGGCTGLFLLGGCGEGAWLTSRQRGALTRAAVRVAAGRTPVLVGVMLPATAVAIEAARQAEADGADALVVGSPYYYETDFAMQQRHVEAIIQAVDLPILLYNIPQATHQALSPSTVATLARDPRILGIKDSAGDFEAFQAFLAIKRTRPSFRALQGNEHLAAASLLQGGDGLVPGLANVAPSLLVALRQAAAAGNVAACARLQAEIVDLGTLHTHGHWLPALKAACAAIGIGNGLPVIPFNPLGESQIAVIRAILERHHVVHAGRRAGSAV
jgi:4-hydroxy-tetrahydrodipicolinate synthase